MNLPLWKQVDDVVQSALDRPPEEREAFLRVACRGDETLEREVRSLLRLDQSAEGFLSRPAIWAQGADDTLELTVSPVGRTIGRYRVLRVRSRRHGRRLKSGRSRPAAHGG